MVDRPYPSSELVRYPLGWHEPPWLPDSVREMHRASQWFLNDLSHRSVMPPRWLTLCGHSGCGKSHLACAIRTVARTHLGFTPQSAQLRNASILASRLREGDSDLLGFLCRIPLLVLDDLGSEYPSDFLRAKFYELLDSRLGRWTVITSNLSLADIADRIDVRIASRIKRGSNIVVESAEPFDFCLSAAGHLYTEHLPKHNTNHEQTNKTQPHVQTLPQQELATPQERAEFIAELHALAADMRRSVRYSAANRQP